IVLIDAENILKSWRRHCQNNSLDDKIDYQKLVQVLSKDTNLLRAYFYDAVPENIPTKKKNFFTALQTKGIQLRTKILKNRKHICSKCKNVDTRTIQKGVDVSLATDILRHAWQNTCNICIVVSGDEDYKDAIECIKDKGIKVWVASFKASLSSELRNTADKIIFIDDIFDSIKQESQK
ncbi:MAG: NYN domain-containing protein, partial [Nanoarchaeota archaeon]